jgi:3alpha(or 20beta)-hydroxysteroid dehydrogenase
MGRVDGKVALISGGARGMGAAHARMLVAEGGKVVIGDILDEEGEAVAAEIGDSVRFTGTFLGMRAAVQPMINAGGGSIINVSSIEGLRGAPFVHHYVASKWAVRGLAKSAALELAPKNIRVNSVHPGFIKTPMTAHLPEDMVTIPLGRPAEPEEVSTFIVFLASDESSYSTGSEFIMDGGLVTAVPNKA